jgi:hypothetical protein
VVARGQLMQVLVRLRKVKLYLAHLVQSAELLAVEQRRQEEAR